MTAPRAPQAAAGGDSRRRQHPPVAVQLTCRGSSAILGAQALHQLGLVASQASRRRLRCRRLSTYRRRQGWADASGCFHHLDDSCFVCCDTAQCQRRNRAVSEGERLHVHMLHGHSRHFLHVACAGVCLDSPASAQSTITPSRLPAATAPHSDRAQPQDHPARACGRPTPATMPYCCSQCRGAAPCSASVAACRQRPLLPAAAVLPPRRCRSRSATALQPPCALPELASSSELPFLAMLADAAGTQLGAALAADTFEPQV